MSPTLGTEVATKHAQQLGLDGRVVVFTGAGSRAEGIGNGRATAILLSSCGAKVVLLDACVGGPVGYARWSEHHPSSVMRTSLAPPPPKSMVWTLGGYE